MHFACPCRISTDVGQTDKQTVNDCVIYTDTVTLLLLLNVDIEMDIGINIGINIDIEVAVTTYLDVDVDSFYISVKCKSFYGAKFVFFSFAL